MYQLASHCASGPSSGAFTRWDYAGFQVSAVRRGVDGPISGDFYTLAVRGPGHIGVVIGDACGHGGDGAAQLSKIPPRRPGRRHRGLAREAPREAEPHRGQEPSGGPLRHRRRVRLRSPDGILTVANAGHVPAMVRRAGSRSVSIVGHASGMPLGIAEQTTYRDECFELNHGDVFVLMTDGVLEAMETDLLRMSTLQRLLADAAEGAGAVHRFFIRKLEERAVGRPGR